MMNTPMMPAKIVPEVKPNALHANFQQPVLGQCPASTSWQDRFGEWVHHSMFQITTAMAPSAQLHLIDTRSGLMPGASTATGNRVMLWESPILESAQRVEYDYEFRLEVVKSSDSRVHIRVGYGYNNSSIHATASTQTYDTIFSKDNQDFYLHKGEDVLLSTVHPFVLPTVQNKVNPNPLNRPAIDTVHHPWNRIYIFLDEELIVTGIQPDIIEVIVWARPIIKKLDGIHYDPTRVSTLIHGIL